MFLLALTCRTFYNICKKVRGADPLFYTSYTNDPTRLSWAISLSEAARPKSYDSRTLVPRWVCYAASHGYLNTLMHTFRKSWFKPNGPRVPCFYVAFDQTPEVDLTFKTILHFAAENGHERTVRWILRNGIDHIDVPVLMYRDVDDDLTISLDQVRSENFRMDRTHAVGLAAMNGHLPVVKLLALEKAELASGRQRDLPLLLAVDKGHFDVADFLLSQSADYTRTWPCMQCVYRCIMGLTILRNDPRGMSWFASSFISSNGETFYVTPKRRTTKHYKELFSTLFMDEEFQTRSLLVYQENNCFASLAWMINHGCIESDTCFGVFGYRVEEMSCVSDIV